MKTQVFDLEGKPIKEIQLPEVFNEELRKDIIRRAFHAFRSKLYQIKGAFKLAGLMTSAEYVGRRHKVYRTSINIGRARLPREKLPEGRWGDVKRVPQAKGGRRAHPPKTEKKIIEKINKKEKAKAMKSAIAATAKKELAEKRGHKVTKLNTLPIVLEDKAEELKKTKEVRKLLENLGLKEELKRCEKKKIKAGKGKMRGRKYKKKKGPLIVIKEDKGIKKAGSNIPGVEVCTVKELNIDHLAPGGDPGRLTVFTESALKEIGQKFR